MTQGTLATDFLVNLAAGFTQSFITTVAGRLRDLAFGTDEQKALQRAYDAAFIALLHAMDPDLDQETARRLDSPLRAFVTHPDVANLLLDIALGLRQPDIRLLRTHFQAQGLDPDRLPIAFDAAMRLFVDALAKALYDEAAQPESPIYNRVSLSMLTRLRQDLHRAQPPTMPQAMGTPFQVPRDIPHFVGRQDQLTTLTQALTSGQVAAVCGLAGLGGIGKSALAAHFAFLRRGLFPDGVLYASLRDLEPFATLALLAGAYGIDLSPYPDLPSRLAVVRSLLGDKRALVILDNAEDLAAVRQLLPCCGERCAVLVTTRDVGLAAAVGQVVRLPILSGEESLRLLRALAGDATVDADPASAAEVGELLGHLPLAVEIAARLAGLRRWGMAELLRRLRAQRGRLELLSLKDLAVRTSFQLSYDLLEEGQRAFFAALGAFRGLSFDAEAAGTVAEVGDAAGLLDALCDRSLLWQEESGRFRQHPLLADYALERLRQAGQEGELLLRHARHYEQVARAARKLYLQGGENLLRGLALFDREWPHIQAGQAWAAGHAEEDDEATRLCSAYPDAGVFLLDLRLHPRDRIAWREAAARAAHRLGDKRTEGAHLGNLGLAYTALGDARQAIDYYEQALAIDCEIRTASTEGSPEWLAARHAEGCNLGNLGNACLTLGEPRRAIGYHKQALAIDREMRAAARSEELRMAARRGEAGDLGNLGNAYRHLGEFRRAIGYHEQALAIHRDIGDRLAEGNDLGNLGDVYATLGETRCATGYYDQALAIFREIGDQHGEAVRLTSLGLSYTVCGEAERAVQYLEQALIIAQKIGDRHTEAVAMCNLGLACLTLKQIQRAVEYYNQALALAHEIGARDGTGITLTNLGLAYRDLGDPARARDLWTQALAIFEGTEDPHAALVRQWLADLPPPPDPAPRSGR